MTNFTATKPNNKSDLIFLKSSAIAILVSFIVVILFVNYWNEKRVVESSDESLNDITTVQTPLKEPLDKNNTRRPKELLPNYSKQPLSTDPQELSALMKKRQAVAHERKRLLAIPEETKRVIAQSSEYYIDPDTGIKIPKLISEYTPPELLANVGCEYIARDHKLTCPSHLSKPIKGRTVGMLEDNEHLSDYQITAQFAQ